MTKGRVKTVFMFTALFCVCAGMMAHAILPRREKIRLGGDEISMQGSSITSPKHGITVSKFQICKTEAGLISILAGRRADDCAVGDRPIKGFIDEQSGDNIEIGFSDHTFHPYLGDAGGWIRSQDFIVEPLLEGTTVCSRFAKSDTFKERLTETQIFQDRHLTRFFTLQSLGSISTSDLDGFDVYECPFNVTSSQTPMRVYAQFHLPDPNLDQLTGENHQPFAILSFDLPAPDKSTCPDGHVVYANSVTRKYSISHDVWHYPASDRGEFKCMDDAVREGYSPK